MSEWQPIETAPKDHPVVRLKTSPIPIDRVAKRVVMPALPEDTWLPMPKYVATAVFPGSVLRTKRPPSNTPAACLEAIGKRRDRMVLVGYSESQGSAKQGAKWVVRCDCGNYEHRVRILRWLGTDAPDMCRECRLRVYKIRGEWASRDKAKRATLEI